MKAQCGHDAQALDDDAAYRSTTGRPHRAQTPGHRERAGRPDATDDEETSPSHASREMQTPHSHGNFVWIAAQEDHMAKRARNEGSIYRQQTDGRWVAAISVGYRNGRRKKFFGATRGAVAAQLTQALHDQQHGLPVAPDRQTVGTFLTRWLEDSVKPSVRPTKRWRSSSSTLAVHHGGLLPSSHRTRTPVIYW